MPLAYLWSAYPLFEAIDAVAIADPTAANRATVENFATRAEGHWNAELKPRGGFAYYRGQDLFSVELAIRVCDAGTARRLRSRRCLAGLARSGRRRRSCRASR
jgi:hypothetical protein